MEKGPSSSSGFTSLLPGPGLSEKLEPLVLAKDVPSDKSWRSLPSQAKGLEARGPDVMLQHPMGRRQHLHKMKILEMKREAELKRCLQREAGLRNPRRRDWSAQQTPVGHLQRNDSSGDDSLLALEHDQMFNGDSGHPWDEALFKVPGLPESRPGQNSKVERWLLKQQAGRESFWDASSTDSETWDDGESGRPFHRAPLVRTKAERIPLFDEFFDKEF